MEEQGYQLINDAKNVVKDLVATKLPGAGRLGFVSVKEARPEATQSAAR